jgi:hypothetical protein
MHWLAVEFRNLPDIARLFGRAEFGIECAIANGERPDLP